MNMIIDAAPTSRGGEGGLAAGKFLPAEEDLALERASNRFAGLAVPAVPKAALTLLSAVRRAASKTRSRRPRTTSPACASSHPRREHS